MGFTGVVVSKLVQTRLTHDADLRSSNFGGGLAQYTAEGGINALLYYWNTRQKTPPTPPDSYPTFPPIVTNYAVPGGTPFSVTTTGTYSITILPGGPPYTVVADATASSAGANAMWQNITRRVTVTIASGSLYTVTGYRR